MAREIGLGRGFDSLIPQQPVDENSIQEISVSEIVANPYQPRREFDDLRIKDLANSIDQHGLLQPVVLLKVGNNSYQVIAGERRLRAFQLLKEKTIPSIVRTAKEQQQLELALIENVQREDLNVLELAQAYQQLANEFSLTHVKIAEQVGRSDRSVTNIIRLLKLPDRAKKALNNNDISEGHARQILSVKDRDKQHELLDLITENQWSVRQTENFVKKFKEDGIGTDRAMRRLAISTDKTTALEEKLGKASKHVKVRIKNLAKSTKLVIEVDDEEELESILQQLL
ncbi:ParB/RepB/Spo0J family partition protein [Candidatus Saccharibacteria bacterium]|nr:ParB/RepB/Spo0J family partition protein [Candidatus Saccharibacteria bacterium]